MSTIKQGAKKTKSKGAEMSFLDHLEVLRWHIIRSLIAIMIASIVLFLMKDLVFETILFAPKSPDFFSYKILCQLSQLVGMNEALCFQPPEFTIIGVGFGELFITHIKVSIVMGFVAAFPYIFWEFWKFLRPGLYEKEQKIARGVVFICSTLFILGVLFGYFIISPFAVTFLAGYELPEAISQPTISSFVNYMIMFTVPCGLVFELPVVAYFLAKAGLITPDFMRKYRKHSFVIMLVLAAIITPPDVVTQILIAGPLYLLYELSIMIVSRVIKKQEAQNSK